MSVEELSRLADASTGDIQQSLEELKKEYEAKSSSVIIINEGDSWKLTVHEQFLPLVQKIVTEAELSKTVVETLAVIAFKYPIKQSDLIRIRTNKAYDHLKELEEMGYISRQKHGRTNLIKLTQKFFEYFDLPEEKLKEKLKDFSSISRAIEDKEKEIETIKQEQMAKAEEEKQKDEESHEIPLETYEKEKEKPKTEIVEEKLGDLDVVDELSEDQLEKERERIEKIKEEDQKKSEEKEKPKFEGPGIQLSKEEEKIVDEKAERIIHPEKETEDEKEKENKEGESKDLLEAEMEEKKEKKDKENNN